MKKVILLSGKISSGKNQLGEYLKSNLESKGMSVTMDLFAKDLKDGCKDDFKKLANCLDNIVEELTAQVDVVFDNIHESKQGNIQGLYKILEKLRINDHNWYEDKTSITRNILQLYGTEIFRNRVDNDWWPKQVLNRILKSDTDVTIVTDTRFPNEITVIDDYKHKEFFETYAVRIERIINTNKSISEHSSETSLDDWTEWSYIVDNNGDLKNLEASAYNIVNDILDNNKEEIELDIKLEHIL